MIIKKANTKMFSNKFEREKATSCQIPVAENTVEKVLMKNTDVKRPNFKIPTFKRTMVLLNKSLSMRLNVKSTFVKRPNVMRPIVKILD